jgi:FAD/FMN-containing dehydrogenase
VNPITVRAFNAAYYLAQRTGSRLTHYDPFFFPLDAIDRWNRLYGKRGFLQFQCVVPSRESLKALLDEIVRLGAGSAITVLKKFGDPQSPGLLSFPRPGFTVAIDLASGEFDAFARLEEVAVEAGGALYPAKDARMSAATFAKSYPRLDEFRKHVDPAFSSSFWRRVAT